MYKREANKKTKGFIKTITFKTCAISIFLKRYKTSKAVRVKRTKKLIYFFNLLVLEFSLKYRWVFSVFHDKPLRSFHQEVPFQ